MTLAPGKSLWTCTTAAACLGLSKRSLGRLVMAWQDSDGETIPRIEGHNGTGLMLFTRETLQALHDFRIRRNAEAQQHKGRGRREWNPNKLNQRRPIEA